MTGQLTWCVADEVTDELGELEANVEQSRQVLVGFALQVLTRTVYVFHECGRQRVVLLV